ncbi:alpha/beta hydrolase [Rhizobium grahamii]|uniref:Esterase n=1 Tax=Rhizobium grahamii TaxID=1120045 RepID=A0A370KJX9_9HYPH|nr:alpha/beta hydrolase [Rhizobium grahamii]RDJ05765.1 esterase [Rhizobium grahamii]
MEIDPFRIRDHVAHFDSIVSDIVQASESTRETLSMSGNVAYGDGPSETLDIFYPERTRKNLPVHMFIHGGYWRMFSKRDYSCVANTVTQAGAIAVIIDYALMPAHRMEVLVDQVTRAKRWVIGQIAEYGGDPSTLTVSGHSAGAHLASFLFHESTVPSSVKGAFLLGGLYDLAPLQRSFLRDEIALTDEEVARFTPLSHHHDPHCRVILAVGAEETHPFHAQSNAFLSTLREQGLPAFLRVVAGRNHMDSVRDLGVLGSEAGDLLARLVTGEP